MPPNSWGCSWLDQLASPLAPAPRERPGTHPPPQPVPLLPDGVHGGLGPVQLLLFAAQHGSQALVLFPQPSQLLLPSRPLFSKVGIQVPAKDPFDLLHCLQNTATETSQVSSLGETGGGENRPARGECPQRGGSHSHFTAESNQD